MFARMILPCAIITWLVLATPSASSVSCANPTDCTAEQAQVTLLQGSMHTASVKVDFSSEAYVEKQQSLVAERSHVAALVSTGRGLVAALSQDASSHEVASAWARSDELHADKAYPIASSWVSFLFLQMVILCTLILALILTVHAIMYAPAIIPGSAAAMLEINASTRPAMPVSTSAPSFADEISKSLERTDDPSLLAQWERVIVVLAWMVVSSYMVLSCKYVVSSGGFPYPLALTGIHMASCAVVFGSIRLFAPRAVCLTIMPDAEVKMSWETYVKNYMYLSFFYAMTLGAGQMAFLFSTVPFIQMMKPLNVISASIAGFILGVEVATSSHMMCVSIIALGVATAAYTAIEFSLAGCLLQMLSSGSEGFRLSLVQRATTSTLKVDPVSTVFYFSFPCAAFLACGHMLIEKRVDLTQITNPWVLLSNITLAVGLNILSVTVIKKTSAVFFTLAGIIKDMGVIVISAIVFHNQIARLTVCGYSISLCGLALYKVYKDNIRIFKEQGFLVGMRVIVQASLEQPQETKVEQPQCISDSDSNQSPKK